MRNWVRLLIFAAVVLAITLTIAPPVRTAADSGTTASDVERRASGAGDRRP